MTRRLHTVLVGATGAVGLEMLRILEGRDYPLASLTLVASSRSEGKRLSFRGEELVVQALSDKVFKGQDVAILDVPDEISREWAPIGAAAGCIQVDNSAAWRMEPDVPLVVPEVNPEEVHNAPRGIIASPNCTTLAMVVPLAPLHRDAGLTRLIIASYQAASGAGQPGIEDLWEQAETLVSAKEAVRRGGAGELLPPARAFRHPLAFNVIPQCGSFREDGYTSEEEKLLKETRKILSLPGLSVSATCVRVPVLVGHSLAIHATFERPITPEHARRLLENAPGVVLVDDPERFAYPTPLQAAGQDPCYVGRIRQDLADPKALNLFVAADNLRKGAALNAIQVAELLA
ncbi:MAG: aspartate-semialdehyde dehydrogenase [Actinomycetota bacterium]